MSNVIAIIQARMSSTRLPGKVLLPIKGKPLLWYVVNRTRKSRLISNVIVATSTDSTDDPIARYCQDHTIAYFRGDLKDVLARYYGAAVKQSASTVVRITSDCPLIDGSLIDKGLRLFSTGKYDYVSNILKRTYPRGFDFEIFSIKALQTAYRKATLEPEREHVTPYIWRNHPKDFRIGQVSEEIDSSKYRITVDTREDFELVKILIERYSADTKNYQEIIDILDKDPALVNINKHIEQKHYGS
jgi:spore coat polysaccharide biosynthesis protein SpsF